MPARKTDIYRKNAAAFHQHIDKPCRKCQKLDPMVCDVAEKLYQKAFAKREKFMEHYSPTVKSHACPTCSPTFLCKQGEKLYKDAFGETVNWGR